MNDKKIFALGFFDGVHLGHRTLLTECVRLARELNMCSAAITFLQHPQSLLTATPPALINTDSDRDSLLRDCGIEHIHKLPVTREVMSTSWQDFLDQLLCAGAAGFVCGDDFRFGHRGEGDVQKLQTFCREHALPCVIIPEQTLNGKRISSTHIRSLIEAGDMETAGKFLGHPHIFSGEVVHGRQLGRTIGIPTANLLIPEGLVVPKRGVYACNALVDGHIYPAVTNVGHRPTVGGHHITVEPWLLDFAGDLYGKQLTLYFHEFLRPEQKFDSLDELTAQIQKDAAETYKRLR